MTWEIAGLALAVLTIVIQVTGFVMVFRYARRIELAADKTTAILETWAGYEGYEET